jgi:phage baseplate assembly protein gpV
VRITVSSGPAVTSVDGSTVTVAVELPAAKVTLPVVAVNVAAPATETDRMDLNDPRSTNLITLDSQSESHSGGAPSAG